MRGHPLRRARSAETDLLIRDGKESDTIFFLHGIGGRASSFAPLMEAWPAGPRLMAWDAPGYGRSLPLRMEWPLAEDYVERLKSIWLDRSLFAVPPSGVAGGIAVVGQSLGALMAAGAATASGPAVYGLVLMSPALGYKVARGGDLTEALRQRLAAFKSEGAMAFAERRAPRLVYQPEGQRAHVEAVQTAMASLNEQGHTQAVRMLASGDLMVSVGTVVCPVLVLNGMDDVVTPLEGARRVFAALEARKLGGRPRQQLKLIPNAGHAVYLEQPSAVIDAISAFLAEAP